MRTFLITYVNILAGKRIIGKTLISLMVMFSRILFDIPPLINIYNLKFDRGKNCCDIQGSARGLGG